MPQSLTRSSVVSPLYRRVAAALLVLVTTLYGASPAHAQLSVGANTDILNLGIVLLGNDTAYDPVNDVYFSAIAYGPVYGAFITSGGARISYFQIGNTNTSSPFGHYPRVLYSPDLNNGNGGFLVTWHQNDAAGEFIHSVVVAYPTGIISSEQIISDGTQGGSRPGSGIGLAYSSISKKIFVTWTTSAFGVQGRFVNSATGAPMGVVTQYVDAPGAQEPSLSWNPITNEFGLAYGGYNSVAAWVGFKRVRASDGVVSDPSTFGFTAGTFSPSVSVNTATYHYILGWSVGGGAYGAEFDQNGAMVGTVRFLASRLGTPTSFELAYNKVSNTFLAVSEDPKSIEVAGVELNADGSALTIAVGLSSGATSGSFVPRLTARTKAKHWSISYARNMNALANQIVSTGSTGTGGTGGGGAGGGVALPLTASISSDVTPPVPEGTAITWTANASGGVGPYQYQFMRYTEGLGWSVAQPYSASNSYTWFPLQGTHAVQVWVRNSGSSAAYDAYAGTSLFQITSPYPTITSFTSSVPLPPVLNVPVTWTATSSWSTGVEYQFVRYSVATGWQIAQPYSPVNTYTWYPPLGTSAIQVWIRRVGSTVTYDDWRSSGLFTIGSTTAQISSVTADVACPCAPNVPITWTAVGAGGAGSLEYKFFRYNEATGEWIVFRDWGASNQATWIPSLASTGLYAVQAWVRTAGTLVTYEGWASTPYFSITTSTSLTLTADRNLNTLRQGDVVRFTATVIASAPLWEFEFFTFNGSTWTLQDPGYKYASTFDWVVSAGTRAVQVWVRPVGSTAAWERWQSTGLFVVSP